MVDKARFKKESLSIIRDVIVAAIVVGIVLGSVVAYTSNWPPLVVVESKSMMHTDGESIIGAIDPGDLVLVKDISERADIITYVEGVESIKIEAYTSTGQQLADTTVNGKRSTHHTYDSPGDVIVYYKNGNTVQTPIIHRALVWVQYNDTAGGSFDIPDLDIYGLDGRVILHDVGYLDMTVSISLESMLSSGFQSTGEPHSGFITLGDHNGANYDQGWLHEDSGPLVEPIRPAWVMGKARGEVPWFGAIKLYFGDDGTNPGSGRGAVPANSWTNMYLTIGILIGFAISLDVISFYMETRRKKKAKSADGENVEVIEESTNTAGETPTEHQEDHEEKDESPSDGAPQEKAPKSEDPNGDVTASSDEEKEKTDLVSEGLVPESTPKME